MRTPRRRAMRELRDVRLVVLLALLPGVVSGCTFTPTGGLSALKNTCREAHLSVDTVQRGDVNTITLRARVTAADGSGLGARFVTLAFELPGFGTTLQQLGHTSQTDADGYAYSDLGADVLTNPDVADAAGHSDRLVATYNGTDAKVKQPNGVNACEANTTTAFTPDQRVVRLPEVGTLSRVELGTQLRQLLTVFRRGFTADPNLAPRLSDGRSACREVVGLVEYVKAKHPEWLELDDPLNYMNEVVQDVRKDCVSAWGLTALHIESLLSTLTGQPFF